MSGSRQLAFNQYRYQILPTTQEVQLDLAREIRSVDDLRAKKNELFARAFSGINVYTYGRGQIVHRKLVMDDDILIVQLGVERDLKRTTRDFEEETVENWPDVLIAMNNKPDVQLCLIQQGGGFQKTATVAKVLEDNLNAQLLRYQLSAAFEPVYEKRVFWDLVRRYKGSHPARHAP